MGAKGPADFHRHVAETAQADDSDFPAFADVPAAQRGIGRDAGAEERGGGGQVRQGGHAQRKRFIHDDGLGIAAIGGAAVLGVRAVVGEGGAAFAQLLQTGPAGFALATRIHQAADGGQVAFPEFFDAGAGAHDASDNFVTGHAGIGGAIPFIARLMHVGVANAAVENLEFNLLRPRVAAGEGKRHQRRGGAQRGVSFGRLHNSSWPGIYRQTARCPVTIWI